MGKMKTLILLLCSISIGYADIKCTDLQQKQATAPLTTGKVYTLTCDLNLNSPVNKHLLIQQSNININCNNNSIQEVTIRTKTFDNPPMNINILNCIFSGQLRISGHSRNGEDINNVNYSKNLNHTQFSQSVAPSNIIISNSSFNAIDTIQIYLSPGVNNVTVKNSIIKGTSDGPAIYLDAESSNNRIVNNRILTDTLDRELVSIDGSANNVISNNYFSSLNNGGIFIYRNCGLAGAVRHQTPSNNQITNNVFFYNYCTELSCPPSIWVSSRNEGITHTRSYCNSDLGIFKTGITSSTNDNDNSQNNTITGNKIIKLNPKLMIRNTEFNYDNIIKDNSTM